MDPVFRHIALCNNAVLPGGRLPLLTCGMQVGWVDPGLAGRIGAQVRDGGVHLAPGRFQAVARGLAEAGLFAWRDEAFDVCAEPGGAVLAQVDRGALPCLGIGAVGVHLNGLVMRGDAPFLWVARRAASKLLDPGKLDHLVAGGVPAGLTPLEALYKEAEEEAGLPVELVDGAVHQGVVDYALERDEGLRRDRLHCYDLLLPEGFVPEARDGEVESFSLWPLAEVLERVRATEDFKFNVPLVLIGLFRRYGLLEQRGAASVGE